MFIIKDKSTEKKSGMGGQLVKNKKMVLGAVLFAGIKLASYLINKKD